MIGEDIRASVFRDTTRLYLEYPQHIVAPPLIRFVRKYASGRILDLGCATGNYCLHLKGLGYDIAGADIQPEYVRIAKSRGVEAFLIENGVPLPDRSFDTVLLFEVLEHLPDPAAVLREARRLCRGTVLLTTPHSGDIDALRAQGLLFEHFADMDHKNFFTQESLETLLRAEFTNVKVWKGNGINPLGLFPLAPVRFAGKVAARLHLIPPAFYFRLYAVAHV
ncbi:MAG: class I SAM-dependent methyltransferase [Ignavibacteriae bacterium]|nr:class I SAM-dependent methyltransferase [Ignavibacteriota bacterium]